MTNRRSGQQTGLGNDYPKALTMTAKPPVSLVSTATQWTARCACFVAAFAGVLLWSRFVTEGVIATIKNVSSDPMALRAIGFVLAVGFGVAWMPIQLWVLFCRRRLWDVCRSKVSAALAGVVAALLFLWLFSFLNALVREQVSRGAQRVVFVLGVIAIAIVIAEIEAQIAKILRHRGELRGLFTTSLSLATKQASLATLSATTLPRLYHEIGKAIVDLPKFPSELVPYRDAIHALRQSLDLLAPAPEKSDVAPKAATLLERAKQATGKVAKATADAAHTARLHAAYVQLGNAAANKYGSRCVPKALRAEYETAQAQKLALEQEISVLSSTAPVMGWLTPRRLVVVGSVASVVLVFGAIQTLRSSPSRPSSSASPASQGSSSGPRTSSSSVPQARAPEQRRSDFALSWEQLLQMTGPEGGATRYIRKSDGSLRRVEARYGGDLLVAVTEVGKGFRVTLGNDLALADFVSRPWFTSNEKNGIIDAYSEFASEANRGTIAQKIGRFDVSFGEDPEYRIKKCVYLFPPD
jgi:hypothetical protein